MTANICLRSITTFQTYHATIKRKREKQKSSKFLPLALGFLYARTDRKRRRETYASRLNHAITNKLMFVILRTADGFISFPFQGHGAFRGLKTQISGHQLRRVALLPGIILPFWQTNRQQSFCCVVIVRCRQTISLKRTHNVFGGK